METKYNPNDVPENNIQQVQELQEHQHLHLYQGHPITDRSNITQVFNFIKENLCE